MCFGGTRGDIARLLCIGVLIIAWRSIGCLACIHVAYFLFILLNVVCIHGGRNCALHNALYEK